MHALANNVIGQLKYDINGAATSLVVSPLAGSPPFNLPPAPTDSGAGTPTYGEPVGILTLVDRLDLSAAKIEHVLYTGRAAESGGAYTYSGLVRGQEGTSAQSWTVAGGAYVIQQPTRGVLAIETKIAMLRSLGLLVHKRDAAMNWDGSNFKFDTFVMFGAGRGRHWGSDGYFTITMPANGTTVKGFGGASDATVASAAIPIAAKHALYFEPNISGANTTIAGNFKLVATTSDYAVPPHWILLAVHSEVTSGDKALRVATGETRYPWRVVGGGGEPAFLNSWVNFAGGFADASFRKDDAGLVYLKGMVKSGTVLSNIFTLPAGYRPAENMIFAVTSADAFGRITIATNGNVKQDVGVNTWIELNSIAPFLATQ